MSVILASQTNTPHSDQLLTTPSHINTSSTQNGQVLNESCDWYKITFGSGQQIRVNVTCSIESNFTILVIISDKVFPYASVGATPILVGGILNATQNVSLSYTTSDFFKTLFGVFLLILPFNLVNQSNPPNMNYTIVCSHSITPYSYDQYYNEVTLPIILIVAAIIIGVAAVLTMYIIKKWRNQ